MNNLTKPDDDALDDKTASFLRAEAIVNTINAQIPQGMPRLTPIPTEYVFRKRDREAVSVALHAAFELIGGVPSLIQWGQSNPDKFYPLYFKLLPSETETPAGSMNINFVTAVPKNPLDLVNVDETGRVYILPADDLPASDLPD